MCSILTGSRLSSLCVLLSVEYRFIDCILWHTDIYPYPSLFIDIFIVTSGIVTEAAGTRLQFPPWGFLVETNTSGFS